jgi:hypothetical protein
MSRQHHEHRPSKREREAKAGAAERRKAAMSARVAYAVALSRWVPADGPRPVDPTAVHHGRGSLGLATAYRLPAEHRELGRRIRTAVSR